MNQIILNSKRLMLRPLCLRDARTINELIDKDVVRYFGAMPWPYSKKKAESWIKSIQKNKELINLVIIRKKDNSIIGNIEINYSNSSKDVACLSYWIGKKYWKKGYASEAVILILDYTFSKLKFKRVYATVNEGNLASKNMLVRLGFKPEGRLRKHILNRFTNKYEDKLFFGILNLEWK